MGVSVRATHLEGCALKLFPIVRLQKHVVIQFLLLHLLQSCRPEPFLVLDPDTRDRRVRVRVKAGLGFSQECGSLPGVVTNDFVNAVTHHLRLAK